MKKVIEDHRGPLRITTGMLLLLVLSGLLACTFAPKYSAASMQQPKKSVLKAGADLQKAVDNAKPGDTIVLEAGATYKGPLKLPNKPGSQWITIQSSALESGLPRSGGRVTPAHAGAMPKIVTATNGEPALKTAAGAHHYRFIGIEFAPVDGTVRVGDLIKLGSTRDQTTLEQVPHHLVFERCYIHGLPGTALKRGIALNSAHTDIIDSYLSEFKAKGQDAQAVCGWNGPGPFRLINNYLEGSGENVMFGGDWSRIPNLVPSDIEVRGNHFAKPLEWRGVWTVKNLFEIKNARRVVIDGNLFEYNWKDGQTGSAILFKSSNANGKAPWSVCEDVTFTNNIVRHAGGGVNILGYDYLAPSRTWTTGEVEHRIGFAFRTGRWKNDDVDWDLATFASGAMLEDFERATFRVALDASNLTSFQLQRRLRRVRLPSAYESTRTEASPNPRNDAFSS